MPQEKGTKDKKFTENKGISTDRHEREDDLSEELRQVIELMGPSTPHYKTTTEDDTLSCSIIAQRVPKECDTPRDVSDYTSFPTDSVEVYLEPKHTCRHHKFVHPPPPQIYNCMNKREFSKTNNNTNNPISKLTNLFGLKPVKDANIDKNVDLYRINILQPKDENCPPKKVIFDLVDEIPKPCQTNVATNTLNPQSHPCYYCQTNNIACYYCQANFNSIPPPSDKISSHYKLNDKQSLQNFTKSGMTVKHNISDRIGRCSHKETYYERTNNNNNQNDWSNMARVDVYYFDHGNAAYYHTTDSPPVIVTEILAEKTENYTIKFWAEVFGTVQIGFSFFTSFVLQLMRFFFQSLLRPLTVGLLQMCSDYFFKPLLATLFNAVIQPVLIFVYNIATSLRDICDPIAEGIGYFYREIAVLFRSIRLIDYKHGVKCSCHDCGRKREQKSQTKLEEVPIQDSKS